jgi:hypothetical protein
VPPQSTPVSLPFFAPSLQVGVWHVSPLQTDELQSWGCAQCSPGSQGPQLPPQSMSVSVPFLAPSVQLGAWQISPLQTEELQS